ncbi:Similar to Pias3: E3 SUMO-protein ligase PIAS3 (Rattus norvegicus) [Cotesia congregata]|uniref:Similar to Pias3: E3 SUMO-protein ligase PIAS3 (Rattus norvegicus) n=1 Tax=Cotesia congregata TaxID=51543 RepID=A0A8J2MPY9_COTCN|nr:Similar to Pias3: E3 SUMO-protein ligase PIAS3 (Rattus norvegicus) [Cotesia congregata]
MDRLTPRISKDRFFNVFDEVSFDIEAQRANCHSTMNSPPKPACQDWSESLISKSAFTRYSASNQSSATLTTESHPTDVSLHQLPVTSSRDVTFYRPSVISYNVAHTSTTRSSYRDSSRPSDFYSTYSSYHQDSRSDRFRPWMEVPVYQDPITTSQNECPCSNSCCAPTYDRYDYEPSFVRHKDYPTSRDPYERYESLVAKSAFSVYKPKSYDRYPKRPVPKFPGNYSQYSSPCESEQVYARPHGNRRYEPYSSCEPLSMRLGPKVDNSPPSKFKKLPFYDFISELMRPKKLEAFSGFYQQNEFRFKLNDREFNTFSTTEYQVNGKWKYKNQVLVRFALDKNTELEDKLPPGLSISVNGDVVLVNEVVNEDSKVQKQGPIDISFSIKLKPYKTNKIVIGWTEERRRNHEFVVGIYLARKNTCSDLFNRVQVLNRKDYDFAKNVVLDKLSEDGAEIAMTDLCVSLVCPLGMMRMKTPCRGSQCVHLQCFDLLMFLQMNEHKSAWNCPICNKPTPFEDIVIDGYFDDILKSSKLKPETDEVKISRDGSWDNFVSREKSRENKRKEKSREEVIDVESDDSFDDVSLIDLVSDEEGEGIGDRCLMNIFLLHSWIFPSTMYHIEANKSTSRTHHRTLSDISVGLAQMSNELSAIRKTLFAKNLKFQNLPFYKTLEVLIRPIELSSSINPSYQKLHLCLTSQEVNYIRQSCCQVNGKNIYNVKVFVRFARNNPNWTQPDSFPENLRIWINNNYCNPYALAPEKYKSEYFDSPLDITSLLKLSFIDINKIEILWHSSASPFAVAVYLVKTMTSHDLFIKLSAKDVRSADYTRSAIKSKFEKDSEIIPTAIEMSLICPLSMKRIVTPCLSTKCKHLQCFDADAFLQVNEKAHNWKCPICDSFADFERLVIDDFFRKILSSKKLTGDDIRLLQDGSWENAGKTKTIDLDATIDVEDNDTILIDDSDDSMIIDSIEELFLKTKLSCNCHCGEPDIVIIKKAA